MEVRRAKPEEMDEVYRLVHDAYLEQGYIERKPDGRLIHFPWLDGIPETTVLAAVEDGEVIGTNSLTVDGPAGLHVDGDFPDQMEEIRRWCKEEGKVLGASWRIATRRRSRGIVVELIDASVNLSVEELGLDVVVIDFNPRHSRFYMKVLGLHKVAEAGCSMLGNVPAVLMMGTMDRIQDFWDFFRGRGG